MPRFRAQTIEIEYRLHGEGRETIVLMMGLGLSMVYWDESFIERLRATGARILLLDHRDSGRSTHLDQHRPPSLARLTAYALGSTRVGVPYDLHVMADDVLGLLDALRIEEAHLVGFSMGGAVAQTVAIEAPHRVRSLTSIASWCDNRMLFAGRPRAMKLATAKMPSARADRIEATVAAMRVLAGRAAPFDADRARSAATRAFDHGFSEGGMRRQLGAILATPSRIEALKALRLPSLVVHGDDDPLVPYEAGLATASALVGSRFLPLAGVGHELPPPFHDPVARAIGELVTATSPARMGGADARA